MGQALCACAGRADDEPHNGLYRGAPPRKPGRLSFPFKDLSGHDSSLLQTQSRTETRELLSDEEREAIRNSVRVIHAGGNYHHHIHHGTAVYGFTLPHDDHEHATESDEAEYYNRQQQHGFTLTRRRPPVMNAATADAFKSKLREPIMSPRSKMQVLVGGSSDAGESDDAPLKEQEQEQTSVASPAAVAPSETSSDRDLRRLRCESSICGVDPADDDGQDDEEDDDEDEHFEYARIIVPPGPCGVVFQTPSGSSMPPTVEGFVKMYDGLKGPIENSGLVHPGSILCAINDLEVENMPLPEVIRALNLSSHLEREFIFRK